ncbi:MAG: helix-turn-helix domain-containing protein, partial [bacterium]
MKRKHFSIEERSIIERLVQGGKSNKTIAEVLGRATSTIGRE